jgi:hypothetical protein
MNWKLKAKIQKIISFLPSDLSYSIYYWIQRNFGLLQDSKLNPAIHLLAGIETVKRIEQLNRSPIGATFLELGTGRRISTPLAFYLLGAEKVITIDSNPYLKEELVKLDLDYVTKNKSEIEDLFEDRIFNNRLNDLLEFIQSPYTIKGLLNFLNVEYIAPSDASHLNILEGSIDFYTSYTVMEHISPEIIETILKEGQRILKQNGLFVHLIDYSDHFSHSDKTISSINFLQFSNHQWYKIAGNRYAYTNQLRHDDFLNLFLDSGSRVLMDEPNFDDSLSLKIPQLNLNEKFRLKSTEILATTSAWIICQKV